MKILIISATDKRGGAGIAAHRLCSALRGRGVDAQMLVQEKSGNDDWVILHKTFLGKWGILLRKILDRLPWWLLHRDKDELLFSTSWVPSARLVKKINSLNADIVHLHWVQGGMLRVEDIAKIYAKLVWTMHDAWLITGGSHYCVNCNSLKKNKTWLSKKNFLRKSRVFNDIEGMTVICPSHWISHSAVNASLLEQNNVKVIPNCIDVNMFVSKNEHIERMICTLPTSKKLILFGAVSATLDINKGFEELQDALAQFSNLEDAEIVIFGTNEGKNIEGYTTHYMGMIQDIDKMIALYNSVDVVVVPSRQENLSNVIMEALSCGTPVVAFDIGGNGEMIVHKKNGYLAKPLDAEDLARGIEWVLANNQNGHLGKAARKKVVDNFSNNIIAQKYIFLYENILHKKK